MNDLQAQHNYLTASAPNREQKLPFLCPQACEMCEESLDQEWDGGREVSALLCSGMGWPLVLPESRFYAFSIGLSSFMSVFFS